MPTKIEISVDAKQFLRALRDMRLKFPETAKRIAVEFADETKRIAQAGIIPVITGNLKSTARVEEAIDSVKFIVGGIQGSGSPPKFVNYAKHVNDGTSRQAAQFYLERSVNIAASKLDSLSRRAIDSWLRPMKN